MPPSDSVQIAALTQRIADRDAAYEIMRRLKNHAGEELSEANSKIAALERAAGEHAATQRVCNDLEVKLARLSAAYDGRPEGFRDYLQACALAYAPVFYKTAEADAFGWLGAIINQLQQREHNAKRSETRQDLD